MYPFMSFGVPRRDLNSGLLANASLSEPCRTLLSHAAPFWATPHPNWGTPHPTEPRHTLPSHAAPYLSQAAPYRATPLPTEQQRSLPIHATLYNTEPYLSHAAG